MRQSRPIEIAKLGNGILVPNVVLIGCEEATPHLTVDKGDISFEVSRAHTDL
jgi:hypothetical protein